MEELSKIDKPLARLTKQKGDKKGGLLIQKLHRASHLYQALCQNALVRRTDVTPALPDCTFQLGGGIDNLSNYLNEIISGHLSILRAVSQGVIENDRASGELL